MKKLLVKIPSQLIIIIISACVISKTSVGQQSPMISPIVNKLPESTSQSQELYSTIAALDSAMFDAFNKRDFNKLKSYFSETLEFYHDLGGVTNYQQNMDAFKRSFQNERLLRRELVRDNLEVYPINNYGAVETGTHRFYATEKGQPEQLSSEAKFVQIWQNVNGTWKVTRIVSFGHVEHLK